MPLRQPLPNGLLDHVGHSSAGLDGRDLHVLDHLLVQMELERRGIWPAPELDKRTYRIIFYRRADIENT